MLIGVHSSKVTLLSFEKNWSYRKSRGTYKVISISRGSEAPFLDVDIRQCSKWSSPCDRFFFPWHRMSFCQRMWEINWKYSNYIDNFPPVSSNVAVENHENLVGGFRHVFFLWFSISYMGCRPSHWLSLHHFSRWWNCTTNQYNIGINNDKYGGLIW